MVSIGVDIGTTTICACVLDTNTGEVLKTWTKKHGFIAAPSPKTKIQSVNENPKHDFSYIKRDYNKL